MHKRIFSLLLALMLLMTTAMPVSAAKKKEEKEPISISTVAEFSEFAEQCRLDSYSKGLTVLLEADLDLTGTAFAPVPIFTGTFQGNGHTISGLHITHDGSVQGLFRYLTDTAVVMDLTVQGTVQPAGSRSHAGGIAGSNAGLLVNCAFVGTVSGGNSVGGLVGLNEVTGVIEQCAVDGTVYGNHFVGGIAGENHGVIRSSVNRSQVNTTVQENKVELTDITVESLLGAESSGTVTDIGGVAGLSNGVIRDCKNMADVGYAKIGYNIGGIAGTQSGYIAQCENHGHIQGRKEIGGIVGQMEPMTKMEYSRDTLQILEGQLNTLSGLTNQASNNAQAGAGAVNDQLGQMQEQAETARDAIGVLMPGSGADLDSITAAQNALSSSIRGMADSMENIGVATEDTANGLWRDMRAIERQINAMSRTIEGAGETLGGSFDDVSDKDTDKELGGKVEACMNYGEVLGDRNVGGIAGAMARENDMDDSEDWLTRGESSANFSGQLRAVILSSENRGIVTGSKQNIGGVVGWQYMGLVKNAMNLGNVEASGADYVGGVAGRSSGYIRGSSAKCALSGAACLGGIAGSAAVVTDCRSLVELSGGTERVGAILGFREDAEEEEEQPVKNNFYLAAETDFGAIDGISYAGLAEPKGMEEFLALKALAEPFRTVTLRFVYENGTVKEIQVPAGGSLAAEDIPAIPERKGYVSEWEGLSLVDLNEILFDMQFKVLYIGDNTVIAAEVLRESGLPVMLAQGAFTSDAVLTVQEYDKGPQVGTGQILRETWLVQGSRDITGLRCQLPEGMDGEHTIIMVRNADGQWREARHRMEGSYAVFDFTNEDTAVAIVEVPTLRYVLLVLAMGAVLLLRQNQYKLKRK